MNDINEFIFNLKEEAKKYSCMDDLLDAHYDEVDYENIDFVETISTDEHRWYILEDNIYKFQRNGVEYYFGVSEVGTLKSEEMSMSDTYIEMKIFEVEKIIKETFKRK